MQRGLINRDSLDWGAEKDRNLHRQPKFMDTDCIKVKNHQHMHQPVFDGLVDRNEFTDSVHCVLCQKVWDNMELANSEKERLRAQIRGEAGKQNEEIISDILRYLAERNIQNPAFSEIKKVLFTYYME